MTCVDEIVRVEKLSNGDELHLWSLYDSNMGTTIFISDSSEENLMESRWVPKHWNEGHFSKDDVLMYFGPILAAFVQMAEARNRRSKYV